MYAAWYAAQSKRDMIRMKTPRHEQWRRLDPQVVAAQEAEWSLKPAVPMPRKVPIRFFNDRVELSEPDHLRDRSHGAGLRTRQGPHTPAFMPRFELPSDRDRAGIALPRGSFRQLRLDEPAAATARLAWLTSEVRLASSAKQHKQVKDVPEILKLSSAGASRPRTAKPKHEPSATVARTKLHVVTRPAISDVQLALRELRFN